MNDYLNVVRHHYADFGGRARRREYWMFACQNAALYFLLALPLLFSAVEGLLSGDESWSPGLPALISWLLVMLYVLVVTVPYLACQVRRLHDTGRSGWWILLAFVPALGPPFLFLFLILDSQPGANRWGANPKGINERSFTDW